MALLQVLLDAFLSLSLSRLPPSPQPQLQRHKLKARSVMGCRVEGDRVASVVLARGAGRDGRARNLIRA